MMLTKVYKSQARLIFAWLLLAVFSVVGGGKREAAGKPGGPLNLAESQWNTSSIFVFWVSGLPGSGKRLSGIWSLIGLAFRRMPTQTPAQILSRLDPLTISRSCSPFV